MTRHAPQNYHCPFCALATGTATIPFHSTPDDIICRTNFALAFIASHWWDNNKGHALIIPTQHYETSTNSPTTSTPPSPRCLPESPSP